MPPHAADFVPPHPRRVGEALDDLVQFIARQDVPTLVHAAVAHAQFETIHPFADGNGRTGRALVQAMLRERGAVEHATVPVSAGVLVPLSARRRDRAWQATDVLRAMDEFAARAGRRALV